MADEGKTTTIPQRVGRVYMDGVFDMMHRGHLEAIKKCAALGDEVVIGVVSDSDCESYKRRPIIREQDRAEMVRHCALVSDVVFPCPMSVSEDFLAKHRIDLVVHGFADSAEFESQKKYFEVPIRRGIFRRIQYHGGVSTTQIIQRVLHLGLHESSQST